MRRHARSSRVPTQRFRAQLQPQGGNYPKNGLERRDALPRECLVARYDVAEHLRTREEMAAYLEASIEESDGDAAFVVQ